MGLLLFHGVGVGKTCSAVTIAEQYLEANPQRKVIVLVPQALKENFKRTVFNPDAINWDEAEGIWTSRQCTGTAYLDRLGLMTTRDPKVVAYKTDEDRRSRYNVTGYQAFANWIERTLQKSLPTSLTDPAARRVAEDEILRRLFSDHIIIIDEAHNLRDAAADDTTGGEAAAVGEAAENAGGKALNPFLKRICLKAEGLRLVLMTATPMYNAAPEIVLLLNYLLMNDFKSESVALRVSNLFTKDNELIPGASKRALERAARRYVSYMRGENPFTFPLRMRPMAADPEPASRWPEVSATKNPVVLTDQESAALNALPLVFTEPIAGSPPERVLRAGTMRALQATGEEEAGAEGAAEGPVRDIMLDSRMQIANITYPNEMYGREGWDFSFSSTLQRGGENRIRTFQPRAGFDVDSVFSGEGLRTHAPKMHKVLESVTTARGISFVYSRYIKSGALPLAAALERAGFQRRMADGTLAPLLTGVSPVTPVCAICAKKRNDHAEADANHAFQPACYVLLTSEEEFSPKFAGLVKQASTWPEDPEFGPLGTRVKVIIGSQVASEGLDLKCVREMHVLDSWYHLNRTEQIIGRAIRYCSHTALRGIETRQGLPAMSLNNTLIYLHALRPSDFESADMYAYRIAIGKALAVGRVQRLLKQHAWDCNLELEAIVFMGLPTRPQIDAQGNDRRSRNEAGEELDGYSPNDQDYTTYCDYEACRHECAVAVARTEAEGLQLETSTFSVSDARRLVLAKQDVVRHLFDDQIMLPETVVQEVFGDLPWEIASEALMELLDGRRFRLTRGGVEGFLVKKAGYVVFQPRAVTDTDIPLAMRYVRSFQLRRRFMVSRGPVFGRTGDVDDRPLPLVSALPPPSAAGEGAGGAGGGGGGGGGGAGPAASASTALTAFTAWAAWVNNEARGALPPSVEDKLKIWSWILSRYAPVPESKLVAIRWWFDRQSYADQRQILEISAMSAGPDPVLDIDIVRDPAVTGYRVFNPEAGVEYFCSTGGAFSPCDSKVRASLEKRLNTPPVDYIKSTGPLLGFLAPRKGAIVFKTLDKTQPIKPSSVGAECGNTSNLDVHHPRIRTLHAAVAGSPLAPFMLPDTDETWVAEGSDGRKKSGRPDHIKDITQQPLCLYMEFLTRLFDMRRVGDVRWFLTAAAAAAAGLKGKK